MVEGLEGKEGPRPKVGQGEGSLGPPCSEEVADLLHLPASAVSCQCRWSWVAVPVWPQRRDLYKFLNLSGLLLLHLCLSCIIIG